MAILLCAPNGPAAVAGQEAVLRIPRLPNPESPDPEEAAEQRVLQRFLALNPGLRVMAAQGLNIPNVVGEATTIMMIAGGVAPDVFQLNFRSLDTFVRQGFLIPLDVEVRAAAERGRDLLAGISPQLKDVVFRTGPDGERRLYALPGEVMAGGIYFNRRLFRRAGLPQRAPRDWEELIDFARQIRDLGGGAQGLFLPSGSAAAWNLLPFVWTAGGEAVVPAGPDDWRAAFDSPEAAAAYEYYWRLVEVERVAFRAAALTAEQREKTGMFFGYGGKGPDDPRKYGFGLVPLGPSGRRAAELNAPVFGISSQIRDPAVRAAAWRYIEFVTGSEAQKIRADTLVEMGEAQRVPPRVLRELGYAQIAAVQPPGFERDYEDALSAGKPEPYGRNCNLVYQEMGYPLDEILLDRAIADAWQRGDRPAVRERIHEVLRRAVRRTNERMMGFVDPETMKLRRAVSAAVVAGIAAAFVFVCWHVGRLFSRSAASLPRPIAGRALTPWLCLAPGLVLIFLWSYLPLFRGTVIAFQDYRLVLPSEFVGLDNFASALFDPSFWNSLFATLHFAAYTLTLGFLAPIVLAYQLHLIPKHRILFRTLYYLPAVISGTAVFFLWCVLFGVDGPLNQALRWLGWDARRAWTDDPALAMLACVLPGIWAGAGPGCLIYLAALKTIPNEQFEAAEIDGAGFVQKTFRLVVPALRPLIFINFIGAVAAAFHGASNILVMTGGGPNGMTEVMSLKIFFESFTRLRFGPATAMAWVLGSMLVGLTVIQLKRLSQMEFKTAR